MYPKTEYPLKGKVLITGGTGSLGSAIVDRAEREGWPAQFTVMARNESKMAQFLVKHPKVRGEIGDVRDFEWLRTILPGHDICIHAAAIKVVPVAEANVREAILTNVVGSQNVAMACVESGIRRVVGVSTDKACAPVTTYGATKYLMEGIFREANSWSMDTSFVLVRYGNVLRSNASVVPLFERLMDEDKPFTITSLAMTRFWLTMNHAINLVCLANEWSMGGVVLVPKPGAMRMLDLARAMDPQREVVEIGIRAGEKLDEMLINGSEAQHTIDNGEIFTIFPPNTERRGSNWLFTGYEYCSKDCLSITREGLYAMLDEYNPYGGRSWITNPKS